MLCQALLSATQQLAVCLVDKKDKECRDPTGLKCDSFQLVRSVFGLIPHPFSVLIMSTTLSSASNCAETTQTVPTIHMSHMQEAQVLKGAAFKEREWSGTGPQARVGPVVQPHVCQ